MDVEETLSAVLNEKRRLGEELAQCTADKEFVWSLWKQLQSSSPDLTSAVSLIVTREKEKNERKDKRVLEILQGKDARILQLEEALLEKSDDLKRCRLQLENGSARLLDQTTIQKSQIENMEGQIEAARNELVQCREEHQSVVAGLETRLGTFTRENSALTAKLSATQAQAEETINLHLRRIESVKAEMLEKIEESNRKSRELQSVTNAKNRLEQDLLSKEDVHKRVESKHEETVAALKETLKLQLKQKSEELTRCKREIDDLKREVELCNGALDRERKTHKKVVREEREACARFEASVNEAQQRHVKEMTAKNHEVLLLQSRIRSLEKEEPETRDIATSPYRFSSPRVFGENSTLERIRLELAKTKQKLEARENELGELRSAQTRRLKRFKSLQNEHRLVLQQLKTYEQSEKGFKATNEWSPSPPRATAKELQQEDSDSVWNELNYYRTQYASLLEEKVLADEECDSLRVKVAEQENIILDLQQCLEQERDELVSQLEKSESQSSKLPVDSTNQKQLELTRNKAEALHESVLQLEEDKQRLIASRLEQQEECFRLREQVARLQTQLLREELHKDTKAVQCQPVVCSKGTDPACAELMRDDDTSLSWADVSVQVSLPQQRLRDLSSKAIQTDVGGGGGGGGESSSRLRSKSAGTPFAFGSHFNPIEAASKIPRLKSKHGEKVKQLELRIASLSRQLAVVQNEKDAYFRALEQQRQAHEELRAVHSACERREETLTEMRRDLESRQSEKTHLEEKLADVLAAQQQIAASLASSSASAARSESEWKQLEHRAKASSDESVRQGKLAKSLKADLQDQEARYKSLQEKVSRLERDVNRKQSLIDDLKAKLKVLREECETAAERVKVVENKLEAAGDMHEQRKARICVFSVAGFEKQTNQGSRREREAPSGATPLARSGVEKRRTVRANSSQVPSHRSGARSDDGENERERTSTRVSLRKRGERARGEGEAKPTSLR
ncbi:centlein-like isoform X2 [Oscarella lobularis]|uniref:centlein-like isoform X2 n=1 Tax=Oscarella lobularis TaxID=121494 RepID=UPI003313EC75